MEKGETLLLGIFTEITERKQAEEKLIESENRYNTFINNNVDMIFVKDEQCRYLVVNHALASFYGKSIDEMLHKTDRQIVDSEWLLPCASSDQKALESDDVVVVTETLGDRIFETTKFRMLLKNGKYGIGGILHDITKRKQSEKALEESRIELQTIYDNAPVMLCLVDEDRKILFANNTFISNTGIAEQELQGGHACGVFGCINAFDNKLGCGFGKNCKHCKLKTSMEDTFKTGNEHRNVEYSTTLIQNGESRKVSFLASTALIQTSGKNKLLLSLHDITERKAAEEALRKSREMMVNSQSVAHICSYSTTLNEKELEKSVWICSPEFYKIFGIDESYPHTIAGWAGFIHPDHRNELVAYHEYVVKNRISFSHEYKIIRINDGAERWVQGPVNLNTINRGSQSECMGLYRILPNGKQPKKPYVKTTTDWNWL
jgi:PAS domain S-box-containing protein